MLAPLYEAAADPERWPRFLSSLAGSFNTATATLRVIGSRDPVVHWSCITGFDDTVDHDYRRHLIARDPFRAYLNAQPAGRLHCSHEVIEDRRYERSEHYQHVFRPNNNFYAMGGHVERNRRWALQIGVHRPRSAGPFQERERRRLEFFSPHLRRAVRIMRRLDTFESALRQARSALDRLPFGVWLLGRDLRCRWMNAAAEDAVRTGLYSLDMQVNRLTTTDTSTAAALRAAAGALDSGGRVEIVPLGVCGASLVLMDEHAPGEARSLDDDEGLLVFLMDPERALVPDAEALRRLYGLTPAEVRLLSGFVQGLDLGEASARLGISPHTARVQLKSVMRKTGTSRQPELMRTLLLGAGCLMPDERGR
ncbi:hypothetical protein B1C78_13085 [Thioalkalivibrio denitrificans]|uniref:HTH luxR-type domain-containing protein n=2 Tax=Thioalkalivibrio denitrificans TaxID=108003 RepID=A0A1V3NDC2_9GAMM|nr:hypothetical protein B1C78_13085 [Thioalkalivibrio denitrificans]